MGYKTAGFHKKRMMKMKGVSAGKTTPWVTETKETGVVVVGVDVEVKSWTAPLQEDVQQAAGNPTSIIMSITATTAETEALFMSKFGNLSV